MVEDESKARETCNQKPETSAYVCVFVCLCNGSVLVCLLCKKYDAHLYETEACKDNYQGDEEGEGEVRGEGREASGD